MTRAPPDGAGDGAGENDCAGDGAGENDCAGDAGGGDGGSRQPRRFPKSRRLRKRHEFLMVQRSGRRLQSRHFTALVAGDVGDAPGRVGITVSRKVGNAVARNRIKRLVREYVRHADPVPPGCAAVFIAKRSAARLSSLAELVADLRPLERRMRRC